MAETLTIEEIAERWQMGTEWVRRLCENGTLPAEQTPQGWVVRRKDVREYEARQYEGRKPFAPEDSREPPESINPG